MKILIVSQYFWPESFIINDLVATLRRQGHELMVLTGKPNYPDGRIADGYTRAGVQREDYAGVEVVRVPLRPRGNGSSRELILNYLSFVWSGLRYFLPLTRGRHFDAILVFAPSPITAAIPAIPLKWAGKGHLAIWIQDLWPESLSATGFVRRPWLLGVAGLMVRAIYACTDTLLIQSQAFRGPVARYAAEEKIAYYPNSMRAAPQADDQGADLPTELVDLLKRHFCIVFAGNIGTAQAVETIVDAAARLRDLPHCKIVLIGSGSMLSWVQERKAALALDQLVLPGRFPMSAMPQVYRLAAGLLVTLKDEEIFSYTVPSKVQAYLAAGKPIVAALNGEGARIVRESGAGLTCPAEDAAALAAQIRALYAMSADDRARMGAAGHRYFLEHFEMGRQAQYLVGLLERRIVSAKGNSRCVS